MRSEDAYSVADYVTAQRIAEAEIESGTSNESLLIWLMAVRKIYGAKHALTCMRNSKPENIEADVLHFEALCLAETGDLAQAKLTLGHTWIGSHSDSLYQYVNSYVDALEGDYDKARLGIELSLPQCPLDIFEVEGLILINSYELSDATSKAVARLLDPNNSIDYVLSGIRWLLYVIQPGAALLVINGTAFKEDRRVISLRLHAHYMLSEYSSCLDLVPVIRSSSFSTDIDWFIAGWSAIRLRDSVKAEELLNEGLGIHPQSIPIQSALSLAMHRNRKRQQAFDLAARIWDLGYRTHPVATVLIRSYLRKLSIRAACHVFREYRPAMKRMTATGYLPAHDDLLKSSGNTCFRLPSSPRSQ